MLGARSPGRCRSRPDATAGAGRCLGCSVGGGPAEAPSRRRSPARTAPRRLPRPFRDWPASPTNGGPPPPASPARGRRGQLKGGGRRAPSSRGSRAPVPALTPPRPEARRPLLRAWPAEARPTVGAGPPLRPVASRRRSVQVLFQASAPGRRRGGKPTRAGPPRTPACFGRLPGCRPGARRWQAGSLHPQRETPGAGLEALCPRKGVVGGGGRSRGTCFSSLTSQLPTPVGLTSALLPPWEQSRLSAKFELTLGMLRGKKKTWQSLGISRPFLDPHQLVFTSIFIRGSANPKTQVAVLLFFFFFF